MKSRIKQLVARMSRIKWRRFLPYLEIYISIPYVTIQTELMNERQESMTFQYISLSVRVWKWHTAFRLYKPREW
jgi:hypothetical protein